MRWLHRFAAGLRALFTKPSGEQQLDEELRSFVTAAAEDKMRGGLGREAALRAARIELGAAEAIKEQVRVVGWESVLESAWQDVRYGARTLRKDWGFTLAAVLTLALGIGANTAIFTVVEAVLLRPPAYRDPGRIVVLADAQSEKNSAFLFRDLEAFKARSRAFSQLAFYYTMGGRTRVTLGGVGEPETLRAAFVDGDLFSVMGIPPLAGRAFNAADVERRERVAVLGYGQALRRFGGATEALGKALRVDDAEYRVIGVMPASFQFPERVTHVWLPITLNRGWGDPAREPFSPDHGRVFYARWQAVARLQPGRTRADAQNELDAFYRDLQRSNFDDNRAPIGARPLPAEVTGTTRLGLLFLWGAVAAVLLIACSNVSNLVLARGAMRQREVVLRAALGASRGRILRQLLTENLLLAGIATLFGLLFAHWGLDWMQALPTEGLARLDEAAIDPTALGFTVVVTTAVALLFGLAPAWRLARTEARDGLMWNDRSTGVPRGLRRLRSALVSLEFALAVLLSSGALLLVRSFLAVQGVDPGFEPDRTLTFRMTAPATMSMARMSTLHDAVVDRLQVLPGVAAVGAIDDLWETGQPPMNGLRMIEGRPVDAREQWTPLIWKSVSRGFFPAMGAPLLRGRSFSEQDRADSPWVAVIDESMARRYWRDRDPVGARIKGQDHRGANDEWVTVIGVVRDMRRSGLERAPIPHVYVALRQSGMANRVDLVVRTHMAARALAGTVRQTVRVLDANIVLSDVATLDEVLSEQMATRRLQTMLVGLFAALALGLAGLGIYAVMQQAVAQRTHEIGIRMALGARPERVLRTVVGEGAKLAAAGIVAGSAGALVLGRTIRSLLFGVAPGDPVSFGASVLVLLLIALLGCYVPARRAARVDPMVALRHE